MTTYDEIIARLAALDKAAQEIAGPSITPAAVTAALMGAPDETPSDDPDEIMDPRD
jgi:hypothetical protein